MFYVFKLKENGLLFINLKVNDMIVGVWKVILKWVMFIIKNVYKFY